MHRPRLKPWIRWEIVPSEGVFLLSERESCLLRGTAYVWLVPLLNGQHTVEDIMNRLHGRVSPAEVFHALMFLRNHGDVIDAPPPMPPTQAAFWELLNADTGEAAKCLQETTVSVVPYGNIDPAPFQAMLASLGIRVGDHGKLWVVLTDSYLQEGIEAFNQEALSRNCPWMLVRPVGMELQLGPLFLPGKTGCWACLAHRLRGAQIVESYLQEKKGGGPFLPFFPATLASTFHTALSIAATETAKWIVSGQNERLAGRMVTFNMLTLESYHHVLVRRPQCSCCGDPHVVAIGQSALPVLQSCKKRFTADGGHRSLAPEEAFNRLAHHISPLTGLVSILQSHATWLDNSSVIASYVTKHNFVHLDDDVYSVPESLRGASGGKGKSEMQAKVSALSEAIERYSGVFQGDEARLRAKLKDLPAMAIHPNACMLFSARQFAQRQQWNMHAVRSTWVPEPFNVDQEIEWSPVWSLTLNELRYIPVAYCYYRYAQKYQTWFARADSNGCAAGHSKEEAILQGFMELVERDSVALWWYNRLKKPAVDLGSFDEPFFLELQTYYRTLHRDLWVLDITSDLSVPTFAAISRRYDKKVEDIIFGFGAHFDPRIAILRALTEVNQSLPAVFFVTSDRRDAYQDRSCEVIHWLTTATLANQQYLVPDETTSLKRWEDYPRSWSDDLYTDVLTCVRLAEERGLETLVLDQTRPDTGLHVVKVFVPGLRHFWARFAPGRLYDVPVRMGWLAASLTEDQLNPCYIYI